MCRSPHEMSSEAIEEYIESIKEWLADPGLDDYNRKVWSGRLEEFERLLKERANNGTYSDVQHPERR